MTQSNNHTIIKAANRQLILNTISEIGPMSVMDILHHTHLSRPTIEALLKELLQDGILEESGSNRSGVGRSAKLYRMGVERHFSIGVDFEYPALRVCAVNLAEKPVCSREHSFTGAESRQEIIRQLFAMIHETIAQISNSPERHLLGIGLGVSGLIDRETGRSIRIERIPDWNEVELVKILEAEFRLPVYMRNDVHMLSLIRQKQRMRKGSRNYIYISLRSGIGMALFLHGKLFSGVQGNAGFFGHTTVDINGPRCCCGNRGCLETYLTPSRMAENYRLAARQPLEYPELLDRYAAGEPAASEIFRTAYTILGKALSNVIKITDIQHVVINGLPGKGTDRLIAWIRQGIESNTLPDISRNILIEEESLCGEEAVGAGIYILRHFFADPKLVMTPEELWGEQDPRL